MPYFAVSLFCYTAKSQCLKIRKKCLTFIMPFTLKVNIALLAILFNETF